MVSGPCWCNTVAYSLIGACAECQAGLPLFLSTYYENCTRILEPSTFPNPVPAGTRVPQWALVDVTPLNYWSASTARLVGDTPEIFPGELINDPPSTSTFGPPPSTTIRPTFSTSFPTSPTFTSSGSRLNKDAIAGGAVPGVTIIATIAGLVLSLFS
ncbi:hypothetical protein BJY52DRAFT_1420507 [Lactarius psammicola]|nr:hypothetical protein BJY52DRAFT_1420507 [Lactarius psammicola]